MMIGPSILFLLAIGIARDAGGWLTLKDIAFLVILGGVILGRYVEFRGGDPRTATGEPATRNQWRRYVVVTMTIGIGMYVVANLIGNH